MFTDIALEAIKTIHPNLKQLSHSSASVLHGCERNYELYKLMPRPVEDEANEHLGFGKVLGIGVQEYFITGSITKAKFAVFLAWNEDLDEFLDSKNYKSFWNVIDAVDKFSVLRQTVFKDYEVAIFHNKPAIELGFYIDCGHGFSYRGFADLILINKHTNELAVIDVKSSGWPGHEAKYKNSGQSIGYSIILDKIATDLGDVNKSSYHVYYLELYTKNYEWVLFSFQKEFAARAKWLKNLMIDRDQIIKMSLDNYFPMRGEFCYRFNRACDFFGICELSNSSLLMGGVTERVEDLSKYQFKFTINELIDTQLNRMETVNV